MNNLSQFTNKDNINLLWDVLLDELHINQTNKSLMSNIRTVFESNIKPFTSHSSHKTGIMELNKQFLSQVVLAVNRLFPNLKQEQNMKKITITNEEVIEHYKIEDIQSLRQADFEKEFERKRTELENYMTPQKPKDLDFSDKHSDGKIKAMDSLVAEKMAQRNLEIEQLQNSNYNYANINPEEWLTSKETSVKVEKNILEKTQPNNRLKYINIDNELQNTGLINNDKQNTNKTQKSVSWDDLKQEPTINIFQKLKRQTQEPLNETINEIIDQKQYIKQESIPLPNVKSEENIRNLEPNTPNTPIIPKNEIIKQLNEMNTKIDNLYEIVFKLTNSMQEVILNKNNNSSLTKTNISETVV